MRITNRNARLDMAGKHNDRNFNLDLAPHIDKTRTKFNKYWTYNGDDKCTFNELELGFYEEQFSKHLEEQNKKNVLNNHGNRNKTPNQYLHGKRTHPEDKIIQIGDFSESVSGETLWACAMSYIERFNAAFGSHCKIVDAALHMDEETPHVHIRRVWMADDKDGNKYVSESKALEQLGFDKADKSKAQSRNNNAVVSFTKTDKAMLEQVCREQGVIFEEATLGRQSNIPIEEYKAISEGYKNTINEQQRLLESYMNFLQRHNLMQMYEKEEKERRKKQLDQDERR